MLTITALFFATILIVSYQMTLVVSSTDEEHKCEGKGLCLQDHKEKLPVSGVYEDKRTPSDEKENIEKSKQKEKIPRPSHSEKQRDHLWGNPFENLDRPVQLVYPDKGSHKKLVLHEENIKFLQYIQEPVATVAVVGKFHTGKSFLLNQLMGKKAGFGVGPYVRPETMGIWMWGKPIRMKTSDGQQVALIFLDTEGFAATNVSETYDAKVFAVATLLSSFLIYNSVKIIDQGDIDYLELLARRTQLFALKSQMSKAKWTDEFNHDLLKFPPLLWVVQDFVQMTDENENNPSKWLHRLLASSSKDSEEHTVSLKAIFPSVDCHTLFLPA
ncbi:guanylate-binding protein 5-like, partial [Actinia tenebrosa]|uniref:Guanylate-binding protein 5-like n=1 Tax=Actinia tenebrosa TaxID=6105 RepID=A0A6P8I8Y0_ACTTE